MLENARQPSQSLNLQGVSVKIVAAKGGSFGSSEGKPQTGNRETSFFVGLAPQTVSPRPAEAQPWIDHDTFGEPLIAFVVPDKHLQGHSHLRCSQTHSRCGVHCVDHVISESAHLVGDLGDGCSGSVEHGVTEGENGQDSHVTRLVLERARIEPATI